VYVNRIILDAVKEGRSIKDGKSFGGHSLQMLRRLPGAKQIDAFYHASERLETDNHLIGDPEKQWRPHQPEASQLPDYHPRQLFPTSDASSSFISP
jgi:hypothetical protein